MPIYEYACQQCGEDVEKLQKLSDAPLTDCPACGQSALKRKISAAGFRLAGGGWYETDFKSDGRRNLSGNNPDSATTGGDGAKSDTSSTGGDKKSAAASDSTKSASPSASSNKTATPSGKTGDS